jgi:ABC-2 type transport system ATP-binding protein
MKTGLIREDVIEVICERPYAAMDLVEKISGVRDVALFGKGLHAVVQNAKQGISEILQALQEAGFRDVRAGKIVPSLEDVFVSLIQAQDRERGSPAEAFQ